MTAALLADSVVTIIATVTIGTLAVALYMFGAMGRFDRTLREDHGKSVAVVNPPSVSQPVRAAYDRPIPPPPIPLPPPGVHDPIEAQAR